jgi:3-oxoacyl-[acyl-carrier protein] reductase
MPRLEGEVALVTGASRGIGRAILARLAEEGAYVIGTATAAEGRARIDTDLAHSGHAGHGAELRVESAASVEALFGALERPPTILVNNAAVTRDGLLARMSEADWDTVIETNLGSVFRLCKACLRPMMRARRGRDLFFF